MSSPTLEALQPGDSVTIKRNLDHPAWKIQGEYDPYSGSHQLVRDPDIAEEIGTGEVTERRIKTVHGWVTTRDENGRIQNDPVSSQTTLVRVSNGFWYECGGDNAGCQENSHATLIEPPAQ